MPYANQTAAPPTIQSVWYGIQIWGLTESPNPSLSLHVREGSSFPGLVPPNYMVNSEFVVDIYTGDSGVVLGIWLMNCSHLVGREFYCLTTHLLLVHGQGVNINPLCTGARVWGLFLFGPSCFRLWVWS